MLGNAEATVFAGNAVVVAGGCAGGGCCREGDAVVDVAALSLLLLLLEFPVVVDALLLSSTMVRSVMYSTNRANPRSCKNVSARFNRVAGKPLK